QYFSDPISPKLLPDPLTEPYYQPPYTLVLEMTDILVHPEYDRATGWRFRKRPGVDALLRQCAPPLFEIVIFTCEGGMGAMPVIDKLDSEGCIMYRLFRDSTLYKNGHHIKDMSALNRDLSKVIVVDWDRNATKLNESNAVHLKRWDGDPSDTTLFDLIPFLRTIATSGVSDVRTVLDFYRQQGDDMLEVFKANQARFLEEEQRRTKLQRERGAANNRWSSGGFTGKLFGSRSAPVVKIIHDIMPGD
ncbi:uncharacterized protein TRIADDRAFT_26300, partial [Trichoplax adhaerens]